nr:ubiquitin hydrolase [Tanacetum cinerariifolium]
KYDITQAQQKALDDALVALAYHLEFEKCNMRLKTDIKSKEATFQVVLDALDITPFYRAFLVIEDVPAIYIHEKTQVYGVILPKELTNQSMLESQAYQTYYTFVSREKTPKPNYVQKKVDSDTSPKQKPIQANKGTRIKTKAKVAKSDKKNQPVKTLKAKRLAVLSEVALTKTEQLKLVTKRSKKDFHISHACGSGDGVDTQSKFPDEHQQKTSGTDEGIGTILGVSDVPIYASESDKESWGDSDEEDDDENDFEEEAYINDDYKYDKQEEEYDDEFNVKGKENINDEETMYDVEDDEVTKELYEDVNINLGNKDADMTNAEQAISDVATPVIKKNITESLEAAVLTRSSSQPQSSYEAATTLFEFKFTKILIDKMEKNKSFDVADYKRELYDALVKSYNINKDIFESYEEPSHTIEDSGKQQDQEFVMGDNDEQLTNKETWISQVAYAEEHPISFDELNDTSFDFSAFFINRLNITNLTQEILVGPAFNLLKGTCKSIIELEYHLEECSKATTKRLDWHNPKNKPYPFDLRNRIPLIQDHRGRQTIPKYYFINKDLEYLKGGDLSRKYSTSLTKTKAATYELKWIEDLVPELWTPTGSKNASKEIPNELKESFDALLVKNKVLDNKDCTVESHVVVEKKIVVPTLANIEFVKAKQQEKPVRKPVKYAEMYMSQGPRGNQRNWNNLKSQQLGSNFVMYNKACFVCGSFKHFWTSAKVKTVNEDVRLQALVDEKKVILNEASIRRDLRLDDAEVEIEKLKKRVKKLEGIKKKRTYGLKRLYKVRLSTQVESSEEEEEADENVEQDTTVTEKEVSTAADEVVTTTDDAEITTDAITPQISKDDVILAQTLIEIKAAKPKARGVIVQEPSEFRTTSSLKSSQLPHAKEKGKGIMVASKKPLKKKDQIEIDKEITRKLEVQMKAEMEEEEGIAREKVEANIAVVE